MHKLALPLGLENASPLRGDVGNLPEWYDLGIRYITLAHSKSNEFADSSYDLNEAWEGLSPAGVQLVKAMNELGVMIDLSHLTDAAAWQVLEYSTAPVVATHSSLRHFIPGFHRNIPDELVIKVAEQGGVIMINFGSTFVSAESRKWSDTLSEATEEFDPDGTKSREEIRAFRDQYRDQNPFPYAPISTVANHFDRVVELTSIDHVGMGSDFDGVGDTLPIGLKDVSHFPNLIAELLDRGYTEDELRKVLGENIMRVWRAAEMIARESGNEPECRL